MTADLEDNYDPPPELGIVSMIGRGGFGDVFVWKRKRQAPGDLPSEVAVKIIYRSVVFKMEKTVLVEDDPETLLSLEHENIVRILQILKPRLGPVRIVMDLFPGHLGEFLELRQCSLDNLRHLGFQIVSGLFYLHINKIVHRDIKPKNILVDDLNKDNPKLMLTDFGFSKRMNDTLEIASTRGTVEYMAPEIVKAFNSGEETTSYVGHKADVFSIGVTFFTILKRHLPFAVNDRLQDDFDLPTFLKNQNIGDDGCLLLLQETLEWDPTKRISAIELFNHAFFQSIKLENFGKEEMANNEEMPETKFRRRPENDSPIKRTEIYEESYGAKGPLLKFYELHEEIGHGAFGKVLEYRLNEREQRWQLFWLFLKNKKLPKNMAVKVLYMHGGKMRLQCIRELEIHMHLKHENVIRMFGYESSKYLVYMKMELANADLSKLKRITNIEKFLPFEVIYFANQIMNGLCYLHEMNIAHRDIKPANILVQWRNIGASSQSSQPVLYSITLKLGDFGLSRIVPSEYSMTMTAVGTRSYMAPEVASAFYEREMYRGDYKKSDVFSAGVVIYEMLQGQRPFNEMELCTLKEATIIEDGCEGLANVLKEMLQWDYRDRLDASSTAQLLSSINVLKATDAEMEKTWGDGGAKALHIAARDGNDEQAQWLIQSGDDVNRISELAWTPLHYASDGGHLEMVSLLIKRGADVHKVNRAHRTPLHYAVRHFEIAQLLIDEGADVNKTDKSGSTPLHLACSGGHLEVARLLLEYGARKDSKDDDGKTPLDLARRLEDEALLELLAEYRSPPTAQQID